MWSGSSIVGRSALVERQRVCLSPVGGGDSPERQGRHQGQWHSSGLSGVQFASGG